MDFVWLARKCSRERLDATIFFWREALRCCFVSMIDFFVSQGSGGGDNSSPDGVCFLVFVLFCEYFSPLNEFMRLTSLGVFTVNFTFVNFKESSE